MVINRIVPVYVIFSHPPKNSCRMSKNTCRKVSCQVEAVIAGETESFSETAHFAFCR